MRRVDIRICDMAKRPDMPQDYLGPQGKFNEIGISTLSHVKYEISNIFNIKCKSTRQVKVKVLCKKISVYKRSMKMYLIFTNLLISMMGLYVYWMNNCDSNIINLIKS